MSALCVTRHAVTDAASAAANAALPTRGSPKLPQHCREWIDNTFRGKASKLAGSTERTQHRLAYVYSSTTL
jgi:hypothetical protein